VDLSELFLEIEKLGDMCFSFFLLFLRCLQAAGKYGLCDNRSLSLNFFFLSQDLCLEVTGVRVHYFHLLSDLAGFETGPRVSTE